jgi:D-xylose 1-dehydrogenase (NADP+, D-xylono-1,5-lactone-forming)
MTIRWGILSTANIGRIRVIPAIHRSPGNAVVAVASRDLARAEQFAKVNDIPRAYGTYEALLADDNVDAIYNPLPNSLHAEWAIRSAEAGKPMLCEKPLARDADEAQRMVDAFASRGVLFAEAFMYRFHPRTMRVLELVQDGTIGDLHAISANFTFNLRRDDDIRFDADLAGGSLMDVGCYCINVIRLMTGAEPTAVKGFEERGEQAVDVNFSGVLRFESGTLAHFSSGLRTTLDHRYALYGSAGKILVEDGFVPSAEANTVIQLWRGADYEEIVISPVDQYQLMVEDFASALQDQRAPRFAPADAVANMRVIDALKASI